MFGVMFTVTTPAVPEVVGWSQFCPVVVVADTVWMVAAVPLLEMVTVFEVNPDPSATLNVSGFGLALRPTPVEVPPTLRLTVNCRWRPPSTEKGTTPEYVVVFAVRAPVPTPQPTPTDTVICRGALVVAHNQFPPIFVVGVPTVKAVIGVEDDVTVMVWLADPPGPVMERTAGFV